MNKRIVSLVSLFLLGACSPMAKLPNSSPKKASAKSSISDCPLHFEKQGFCGQLARHSRSFPIGKFCHLKLGIWQRETGTYLGPYVDPGLIPFAWIWMHMPSGSHGSLPILIAESKDESGKATPGIYDLSRIIFTMPPRSDDEWWEIHIELRQSDGTVVDEAVQTVWNNQDV